MLTASANPDPVCSKKKAGATCPLRDPLLITAELLLPQGRHRQGNIVGLCTGTNSGFAGVWRNRTDRMCALALRCPKHKAKHAVGCACPIRRNRQYIIA